MPLIVPLERQTVTGSSLFSSYKDVSLVNSEYFILQVRKDGRPSREGHRAAFRIITKGEHPFYIVAYGHNYNDIIANEWHYLTVTLPTLMPSTLDLTNVRNWIVAHITNMVLSTPESAKTHSQATNVDKGKNKSYTYNECEVTAIHSNEPSPLLVDGKLLTRVTTNPTIGTDPRLSVTTPQANSTVSTPGVAMIGSQQPPFYRDGSASYEVVPLDYAIKPNYYNDNSNTNASLNTHLPTDAVPMTTNGSVTVSQPATAVFTNVKDDQANTLFLRVPARTALIIFLALQFGLYYLYTHIEMTHTRVILGILLVALLLLYSHTSRVSMLTMELDSLNNSKPGAPHSRSVLKSSLVLSEGVLFDYTTIARTKSGMIDIAAYRPLTLTSHSTVDVSTVALPVAAASMQASALATTATSTATGANQGLCSAIGTAGPVHTHLHNKTNSNIDLRHVLCTPMISSNTTTVMMNGSNFPTLDSLTVSKDKPTTFSFAQFKTLKVPTTVVLPSLSQLHTLSNIQYTRPSTMPTTCYEPLSSSHFSVRQLGYKTSKQKAPSQEGLFEFIQLDVVRSSSKVDHISQRVTLPIPPSILKDIALDQNRNLDGSVSVDELTVNPDIPLSPYSIARLAELVEPQDKFSFPPYLVITFQAPSYAPSMFGSTFDGDGYNLVFYFALSGDYRRTLIDMCDKGDAAAKLIRDFAAADLVSTKNTLKGRMKGLPKVMNLDELDLGVVVGNTIHKYNGTPFLTGPVHQRWHQGKNYLEVNVDVHEYCYIARKAAHVALDTFSKMVLEMGFVIEGRGDEELPERMLGACMVKNIDLSNAPNIDTVYPLGTRNSPSVDVNGLTHMHQTLSKLLEKAMVGGDIAEHDSKHTDVDGLEHSPSRKSVSVSVSGTSEYMGNLNDDESALSED